MKALIAVISSCAVAVGAALVAFILSVPLIFLLSIWLPPAALPVMFFRVAPGLSIVLGVLLAIKTHSRPDYPQKPGEPPVPKRDNGT